MLELKALFMLDYFFKDDEILIDNLIVNQPKFKDLNWAQIQFKGSSNAETQDFVGF